MGKIYDVLNKYVDMEAVSDFLNIHYSLITVILAGMISLLFLIFIIVYMAGATDSYKQTAARIKAGIVKAYNDRTRTEKFRLSYNSRKEALDRLGVTYYSKGKISPLVVMIYKMAVPFIAVLFAVTVNGVRHGLFVPVLAAAVAVLYAAPKQLAKQRNKKDNEKMLGSIIDIYDIILLQLNSGEYITQVIIDAYRVATNRRLKAALIELTGDIMLSNDLIVSMEIFGSKFDNNNIDNLVALVKQMAETGATADMLSDINRRLFNLQKNYNAYRKERVNTQGHSCAFAMFVVIISIMGYLCMSMGPQIAGMFSY